MEEYKYSLAIVAIMKYEEDYVEEWVKYHLIVGVKHFYIYDNNETSTMKEVLKHYIEAGIVDLIPCYGERKMFDAYNDAIRRYKDECKYIAFIDADEFIVPIQDVQVDTLVDSLFEKYDKSHVGGLGIRWKVYGTSHHVKKPDGYVIENYLYTDTDDLDRHIKSIVNPRAVVDFGNPHFCRYQTNYYCIDENGKRFSGPFRPQGTRDILRLNHYYYKSEEEFTKTRLKRGKCDIMISEEQLQNIINAQLTRMQNSNKEYDDIMLRYIDRLKK